MSQPESNRKLLDDDTPLGLSIYFTPFEIPHTTVDFSPVKWYFMPGFRLDIPFLIVVATFAISITGFALLAIGGIGSFVALGVCQVIAVILGVIRVNIAWNNNLRSNLCYCYSKSQQAKALWEPETSHERLLQKDVFHEESGIGYKIRVLRDGTVEMHAGDLNDQLHDNLIGVADNLKVCCIGKHLFTQVEEHKIPGAGTSTHFIANGLSVMRAFWAFRAILEKVKVHKSGDTLSAASVLDRLIFAIGCSCEQDLDST